MYYVDPGESFHKSVAKFGVDTAENEFRVNPNRVRVLRVKLRVITSKKHYAYCALRRGRLRRRDRGRGRGDGRSVGRAVLITGGR